MSTYRLFVPKQAVGANLIYFDLWNPTTSGRTLEVMSVVPVVSGAVAVVGTLAVDLFLNRTTAIGTGGTAATYGGSSLTACTFSAHSGPGSQAYDISARLTPTGGATAGEVLSWCSVFTEETNAGTYTPPGNLVLQWGGDYTGVMVSGGSGISIVQGDVASVGNIGFNVIFKTHRL